MKANNYIGKAVRASLLSMALLAVPGSAATPDVMLALQNGGVFVHQPSLVEVDGIVILKGKVGDRSTIERATAILHRLGITRVANLLQVTVVPQDEEIRRNVERNLVNSRSLEGCQFNVTTRGGVVRLEGTVREPLQRELASDLVRAVSGVRQVVNDLSQRG